MRQRVALVEIIVVLAVNVMAILLLLVVASKMEMPPTTFITIMNMLLTRRLHRATTIRAIILDIFECRNRFGGQGREEGEREIHLFHFSSILMIDECECNESRKVPHQSCTFSSVGFEKV